MKLKKWIQTTAMATLLFASVMTPVASAEESRSIADESIYDLLVDRYFNGTNKNDDSSKTNPKDLSQFAGGDFQGIKDRFSQIQDMGFTILSLGSIFATETYDGSSVTSYQTIEPNFGTEEEFKELVEYVKDHGMSVMVDFPLTNVSENHEWAKDASKASWILKRENGKVQWNLNNKDVQQALIDAVVDFVSAYDLDGVRLTNIVGADTEFLNDVIAAIKSIDDSIYVISNSESDANFDAKYYDEVSDIFRYAFKNVDEDTANLMKYFDAFAKGETDVPTQIMIDHLNTDRFLYTAEIYPPTRLKMVLGASLLLPGVPVMSYATEIAVNGQKGPEAHQLYNFKTDTELKDYIGNILTLRNESETLRNGEFKMIQNEDGLIVFQRKSDKENWIIIANNTSKRQKIEIPKELVGENKEIRGTLEGEIFREGDDGVFRIIQDRETVEMYQVIDEQGINISYMIALALVYIIFIAFVIALIKRGKRKHKNQSQ
ncbi:alpha-amylase family glycosyl hydrolase [Ureibacillus thermophilus]|uniref:alpha-amylase family glycosyl hydrolase n=1 Tax=Ureibacillus thermophilus TaxID=367743 RepID=UPI00361ECBD6